jgi:hypothetical protein
MKVYVVIRGGCEYAQNVLVTLDRQTAINKLEEIAQDNMTVTQYHPNHPVGESENENGSNIIYRICQNNRHPEYIEIEEWEIN